MKRALVLVVLSLAGCSSSGGDQDTPRPVRGPATVTLDLSHYSAGNPAFLSNSSLAFRPDLAETRRAITGESDAFREVYDRVTCSAARDRSDPAFALSAFGRVDPAIEAPRPLRVAAVTLTLLDDVTTHQPAGGACFAYHTADGQWHGHLVPVKGTYASGAGETRVTLDVDADNVDVIGIMFEDIYVLLRDLSYTASDVGAP